MNRKMDMSRGNAGAVLLAALGILFLLSMLGVAYLDFMWIEVEETQFDVLQVQTRVAARAGVEAAISEMQKAVGSADATNLISSGMAIQVPFYGADREKKAPLAEKGGASVRVTISDESGKLNLNHAPPRALEMVLGVDGNTARTIRSSLPVMDASTITVTLGAKPPASTAAKKMWLSSVADLGTRKLVPDNVLAALDKDLVTVYSVVDHTKPVSFLNVNTASPKVLAAILDITPEAAELVAARRPFTNLADLTAAAGKEASTFTFAPAPAAPNVLAPELSFDSRCFRFVGEASTDGSNAKYITEAVVVFGGSAPQVTYWSESVGTRETTSS